MNEKAAREVLRRLVAYHDSDDPRSNEYLSCVADARALLASTSEEGPVAEGFVRFEQDSDDAWYIDDALCDSEPGYIKVRIPVPAHLVNPPVVEGEVVK
jgi:hypothetical protein